MTPEQIENRLRHELEQHWAEWRTTERQSQLRFLLEQDESWLAWDIEKNESTFVTIRKALATILAEVAEREQGKAEGGDDD